MGLRIIKKLASSDIDLGIGIERVNTRSLGYFPGGEIYVKM